MTVDPGSPSEKEYAIPITKERRDASASQGKDAPVKKNDRSAPLFGQGVGEGGAGTEPQAAPTDPGSGGTSGSAGSTDRAGSSSDRGADRSPTGTPEGAAKDDASGSVGGRVRALASSPNSEPGPLGGALAIGAGAGLIGLAAVLGGIALRRRRGA